MVEPWVVSVMAFAAAWSLWLVRPMPRLIRISMIVPMVYFGGLYLWVQWLPFQVTTRTDLVRLGLLMIFVAIIANSLSVRLIWLKRGRV